jgi:NAD(P)-dependent dehydrogenase (short-subunit alcohol dehydrogenase family)
VTGVLVTGASGGIGRACVAELSRQGLHVFAGVRDLEVGRELAARSPATVTPVLLDVTDEEQVRAAADRVAGALGGDELRGVVNNAGIMVSGPLEHVPLADVRRHLEVNLVGPLTVVQAFLPLLRASRGRVVNIGSTSGRVSGRFVGAYAASKAGLESLGSTLRLELSEAGVAVVVVEPGVVATELWDRELAAQDAWLDGLPSAYHDLAAERRSKLATLKETGLPPETVAAVVAGALLSPRPRPRYVVGRRARLVLAASRVLPERALIRLMR